MQQLQAMLRFGRGRVQAMGAYCVRRAGTAHIVKSNSQHVNITDVARESGFAPSTVSIVLNDAPLSARITARTKKRIRDTAERLGYRPDAFARSLRNRRSHTIGVVVFDLSDPYCSLILRGIEGSLQRTEYLPLVMNANNNHEKLVDYLDLLRERRVEGVIVVANWLFDVKALPDQLRKRELRTVVVGRNLSAEGIPSIIVDNERGGCLALEHLHALGHRKIAIIRGPRTLTDSLLRWRGIQRSADERGVKLSGKWIRQLASTPDPTSGFEGGLAKTAELLARGPEFTALIAFDDLTALGAVRALHANGLRVPMDCSIVGFDDVPPAWLSTPSLTTLRQPMEQMGRRGAECVLEELRAEVKSRGPVPLEWLQPVLIERESTRPLL